MSNIFLSPTDYVGVSFWIISAAMVAATFFFWVERDRAVGKWKTSLTVAAMVTGIAAIHYFYMRDVGVEFYLILAAITAVAAGLFWRLMIASVVMLVGGYLGEVGQISATSGFIIGMLGWAYIIYEIFLGEASKISAASGSAASQKAFNALRLIVTIGWAIYPLGYLFGYMVGSVDVNTLNLVYNLADFVNKIAFGVVIWAAATSEA